MEVFWHFFFLFQKCTGYRDNKKKPTHYQSKRHVPLRGAHRTRANHTASSAGTEDNPVRQPRSAFKSMAEYGNPSTMLNWAFATYNRYTAYSRSRQLSLGKGRHSAAFKPQPRGVPSEAESKSSALTTSPGSLGKRSGQDASGGFSPSHTLKNK